ncbi:MAG TPA: 16S rRNA (adenine(1518)-N(6)/adenine(1519)-N(6))-dimethyltransferase RsmA [Steroidobacteraceae bacterium]|nr:16S rRNA (adenine(1518)-N(6)/adenine(1519)-N(6))-dimethyltransferase RsmA [Steroidobacteraceae bacterium]
MRARKRFGQHFLLDRSVIDRIVATIDPQPGERLVEIGPGLGAITIPLLERLNELDAIEIDRDAIRELRAKTAQTTLQRTLRIHEADALRFDLRSLNAGPKALRIIGNLPYNISTPLLFHLIEQIDVIRDMHFMLQKEVVDRIAAAPGDEAYGRLTVMLAPHVRAESLFDIAPGAFRPPPKVHSTFFRLTPHIQPPFIINNQETYARVVSAAFTQRRKTLRNALKGLLTEDDIRVVEVDPGLRAEVIAPMQYAALAAQLDRHLAPG